MVLEKTLESPLDCKEIQPVHPKEISPGYSSEGLMLKLKLQYFGHLMRRADSFEKTLILGKIEGRRRRGRQRMRWLDGISELTDMGLGGLQELVMDREAWSAVVPPAKARDLGLIPGLRGSPGEGNGNTLQYSCCLENPMDRGAWRATVHGVAKSWTRPSN